MKIKTDHKFKPLRYRYEVPARVLASYFDWTDADDGFFCYRGTWYHISQFERAPEPLAPWDGYHGDSYFSGVVIKLSRDGEDYMVGTYIS